MPKADTTHTPSAAELLGCSEPLGEISIPNGVYLPELDEGATYAMRLVGDCLAPVPARVREGVQ